MTQAQILNRKRAVAAAVGSVRAEGLEPSVETQRMLNDYAEGKISMSSLRERTLAEIKSRSK